MADQSFDEMVETVLNRVVKPRRFGEPQRATPLSEIAPTMVATPHGNVAAWREGDGPATILVHGWQDDSSLWSPLMVALQASQQPFVAFDLPAHGFSEGERGLTFETADALHAVAERLGPVESLVAHSFASGGSTLAASEGLPISRLALIAPPLWPASASRFHRVAAHLGYPEEVGDRALAKYSATTTARRVGYDVRRQLVELDASVLLVAGVDDERMAVDDARVLAPSLTDGELFEVDGVDHRETAQDPRVISRVIEFLTSQRER